MERGVKGHIELRRVQPVLPIGGRVRGRVGVVEAVGRHFVVGYRQGLACTLSSCVRFLGMWGVAGVEGRVQKRPFVQPRLNECGLRQAPRPMRDIQQRLVYGPRILPRHGNRGGMHERVATIPSDSWPRLRQRGWRDICMARVARCSPCCRIGFMMEEGRGGRLW